MSKFSPLIDELIEALRCLPSVGPKSAQRMAFHLLERNRRGGNYLAHSLTNAMQNVGHCHRCRTFCEDTCCHICSDPRRDHATLCIVESPIDILAIEQTSTFHGLYFVLMGRLSPLDGIGPEEIGINHLKSRFAEGLIQEVILATNLTVEGEATAHYIAELAKSHQLKSTRIAHGIPLGGELEYIDGGTLAHAFSRREPVL